MKYSSARPYLATFVLLKRDGKVAFVLRENTDWMNGYYGLVAGKAEEGETAQQAIIREAQEEAGVKLKVQDLRLVHMCHRKADDDTMSWIDVLFEATNWGGEPHNAEPHKHAELAWLDIEDLPENIVPAVGHYMREIKAGKIYSEYGWE